MVRKRFAIACDFAEEQWPSMDLVAEMLSRELRTHHANELDVSDLRPALKWRIARLPLVGKVGPAKMVDRLINRMGDYPRWLAKRAGDFDYFHIADHSYSQLVHVLPADRTGVFCHDLDTFRCILDPAAEPRPAWFRKMAQRILAGMQKARVVFHSTNSVRDQILKYKIIDPAKLVQAPYGIAAEFTVNGEKVDLPSAVAPALASRFLLHVGSCIPRKRIDVLLDVFGRLCRAHPELWLVQLGGEWTPAQSDQIRALGIGDRLIQLRRQSRPVMSELYRSAELVLTPSESEGFGLPVAEALGCGAVVVASDIEVLREVGGDAAVYCPLADIDAWSHQITSLLAGTVTAPSLETRLVRGRRYSWATHARIIAEAYLNFD